MTQPRVLIVDDEKQIRRIVGLLLKDRGFTIEEAASGEEAIERFAAFRPRIVLLDLSLPGIDGLETLRRLLAADPGVGVVIMTAYGSIRSAVEAMRAGAFDYLAKPFDNDELLLILDRLLEISRLSAEVESLRTELESRYGFSEIVGISREMQDVFRTMTKVAQVDATVLVTGESGTGKELVARAIHRRSGRGSRPFVAVNCGAIPANLVEAEFFGAEKGAFTDARESRPGKFEQADGGTLFLDEIGELPLESQAKLLRVLEEGRVVRLGATGPRSVDTRVVAATNRDLEAAVAEGRFREDLWWRINVVTIALPSLRQRRDDLPLLIDHLLERLDRELGTAVDAIEAPARDLLLAYDWPGNVRELENTLRRAMILCDGHVLTRADLPPRVRGEERRRPGDGRDADEVELGSAVARATEQLERNLIAERLKRYAGNRTAAAESLGVSRKTLFNKMRQYGL